MWREGVEDGGTSLASEWRVREGGMSRWGQIGEMEVESICLQELIVRRYFRTPK